VFLPAHVAKMPRSDIGNRTFRGNKGVRRPKGVCHGKRIRREKQIKEWKRAWKLRLIESVNPEWRDLHDELI